MTYPKETLKLAATLLDSFELDHAVMTLKLQCSLYGGCCGMVGPNYEYAAALGRLAAELESCSDKPAAVAALARLRGETR
ncbi:MAG TPA: hypothetical protein VLW45_00555 [Pelomicrobium sp.]|nr:hypothetical protein [Pelomicrobium sp.]